MSETTNNNKKTYFVTGGGTGGHVNPGLAIAKYAQSRRNDVEIRFAGTSTGIESKLVPREGYKLYTVDVRGLKRSMSPSARFTRRSAGA